MPKIQKRPSKKALVLILSLSLVLILSVGVTAALLISRSEELPNTFVPTFVRCEVLKTAVNGLPEDVSIQNTGDIPAFIRAAIVVNWVLDTDSHLIHGEAPKNGTDYTLTYGTSWQLGSDGYWYYTASVDPTALTDVLLDSVTLHTEAPEGYHLAVEILATAIQAEPERAAEEAWGVTVTGNTLSAP
ncbi:MAG: hypothetical protein IKC63_04495 [Clostridia bacterium]|nr:hypothetical protein [Clostridia bacterium]